MSAFIVVEGLEGAGKSTVIAALNSYFSERGYALVNTREPGGTPMSEAIRDCVKKEWPQEQVTQQTELFLMYAARSQLLENVIKPALASSKVVVGDRHDLSSRAYQGGGRGIDMSTLDALRDMTLGDFRPDFTLYLDIDPELGLTRARGRGELDRIEQAGLQFFQGARACYQHEINLLMADQKAATIDASQTEDKVREDALSALDAFMLRHEKQVK